MKREESRTLQVLQMGSWPLKQRWESLTLVSNSAARGESGCLYPSPWSQSKVKSHLTTRRSFNKSMYDESLKTCFFLLSRLSSRAMAAWLQGKKSVVDTDTSAVYCRKEVVAIQQRKSWNLNAISKKWEEGIILTHIMSGKMRRKLPPSGWKLSPSFTAADWHTNISGQ